MKEPNRCQFFYSDDRRCRMPRWERHKSLCVHHARRLAESEAEMVQVLAAEEVAQELVSRSGEFITASDVNHVLGKLLRLLAKNRIPRRNAVVLAYICQLLLNTLESVKHEIQTGQGREAWSAILQDALPPRLPNPQ